MALIITASVLILQDKENIPTKVKTLFQKIESLVTAHGGVSTGGKWVLKYHCMFRRSGINSLNPSHLPPTNPVVCEILKELQSSEPWC